ncbi:hypothetical protein J4E93_003697 [Alternaria ventricosa]|uniref:uncharacterized protein n=1 Tax=Alternaria ventricosa TaxID=1187951 RepID=UPI0020C229ED|nr:uncharacterized protein J4E93_003697 [Alternaria ventricosa]KAI4649379.1 hypothetical protein J4E93_003697 [Alternaria ventricosa]
MKKHQRDARKHLCAAAGLTLSAIDTDRVNSTTEFCDLRDCFLVSLGDGLVYWPGGADQGVLTLAVWHARRHGHNNVRLSQLERYVEQVEEDMVELYGPLPQPSALSPIQTDWYALERIFPQQTYDATRTHDPTYDVVRKWWAAGRSPQTNPKSTGPPRDPYDGSLDPFQRTMLGTPSTTTPEDCYVNAIAPTEEPMGHLNESTTNLDVQGPILRPEKYDTRFGDTNTLGIEEENVGFERWKTRSGVSAIVNSPQYDSKYNLRFPRTTNNQAKISSSTKTGGLIQSSYVALYR